MKINQTDVKRFLQFARKFWDSNARNQTGTVVLAFTATSYSIAMTKQNLMLTYLCNRVDAEKDELTIAVPLDLLVASATGQGLIQLDVVDRNGSGHVRASWHDGPVPQSQTFELFDVPDDHLIPELEWHTVDERFLRSIARAAEVTDDVSQRYGLSCIELDGRTGTATATDGKQLLRYEGFAFPWPTEALLIRRNKAMSSKDWLANSKVNLARSESELFIRADKWTMRVPIERDVRFPNCSSIVPKTRSASNRVQLHRDDSTVLLDCIGKLPGGEADDQPVVLDLNGHVVVRSRSARDGQAGVSLTLARSLHIGCDSRTVHNRQYLERAARLGAKTLYLFSGQNMVMGQGDRFKYLWMSLTTESTEPDPEATVQISSAIPA